MILYCPTTQIARALAAKLSYPLYMANAGIAEQKNALIN
jgi:hypothetical protein